ncbi:MAG: hypothetical protein ABL952_15280 [Pyrinomonadaceae bacterium]
MKKIVLFAVFVIYGAVSAAAQESTQIVSTSTMDAARFEIIQSPLDRGLMFRLDKFAGTIDRLGTCPKDDGFGSNRCWKEMIVLDLSKAAPSLRTRYQLIINGPQRLTMLLQIDTGKMWQWGLDREERWYPFIDCTDKTNTNCLWRPVGG